MIPQQIRSDSWPGRPPYQLAVGPGGRRVRRRQRSGGGSAAAQRSAAPETPLRASGHRRHWRRVGSLGTVLVDSQGTHPLPVPARTRGTEERLLRRLRDRVAPPASGQR